MATIIPEGALPRRLSRSIAVVDEHRHALELPQGDYGFRLNNDIPGERKMKSLDIGRQQQFAFHPGEAFSDTHNQSLLA